MHHWYRNMQSLHSLLKKVGRRGLPESTLIGKPGEACLQMRTSALFGTKNFRLFEIYGVSARTLKRGGGLSQCENFADEGGQVFVILCKR